MPGIIWYNCWNDPIDLGYVDIQFLLFNMQVWHLWLGMITEDWRPGHMDWFPWLTSSGNGFIYTLYKEALFWWLL